jgi:molybdenum cofactor cytidylyltransferase
MCADGIRRMGKCVATARAKGYACGPSGKGTQALAPAPANGQRLGDRPEIMTPKVAAIVLAAGRSTRMGAGNKLVAEIGGKPMVRRVTESALASRAGPVIVVIGHQSAELRGVLGDLKITLVRNGEYAGGLSTSLKAGLRAVPRDCHGVLVLLGDMPAISAEVIDRLLASFTPDSGQIVVPTHAGKRGNPVLWSARYFPEMLQLDGDTGAKSLLGAHAAAIKEVELGTAAIFADVDTPDALALARTAFAHRSP